MSHKLLLADGSAAIQRVVELMFSSEDVEVVAVDDGQQAIERLPAERPDVVLADIGTARRSGYEVAAFVKDHPQLSHVPVLLLAGAFEPVDEARASQVRSAGVLVKPLEPRAVVSRVRSLVESSRQAAAVTSGPPSPPAPDSAVTPVAARSAGGGRVPPPGAGRGASPLPPDDRPSADAGSGSLDDYFDRLDAAFATLGTRERPAGPDLPHVDTVFGGADVPTLDDVLGNIGRSAGAVTPPSHDVVPPPADPAGAPPTLPAPPPRPAAAPGRDALAELFRVLLAVEQGEADVAGLTTRFAPVPVELTDELVERITRRVVERLGTEAVRDVVEDVVSDVAERLVRQEIDRIRRG